MTISKTKEYVYLVMAEDENGSETVESVHKSEEGANKRKALCESEGDTCTYTVDTLVLLP